MILYTDGACSGNPGPGAWAYLILDETGSYFQTEGSLGQTTNNVAELTAILYGLSNPAIEKEVTVVTDSQNAIGWLSGGWKRKDLKIKEIAEKIDEVISAKNLEVKFLYVKGHDGDKYNEIVNKAAQSAIRR